MTKKPPIKQKGSKNLSNVEVLKLYAQAKKIYSNDTKPGNKKA
jgi:hypothetical protein